ncbi:hypothetical protein GCM10022244_00500 [Streptomyces gulbargensis]|uniref:Uncharacterized protein n=1 Tax=Streptomyces gulbargensis TaxID=364901 RepID=A0ABP7L675_9ACTN
MRNEDRDADRTNERWKAKGIGLRVFFYVVATYLFFTVVGHLAAQAQE